MNLSSDRSRESILPTILCLHGAGTNAGIFRAQARMIIRKLSEKFQFVFLDAPFESLPGPGVIPTYDGLEPYLWWHCDPHSAVNFDISADEVAARRRTVREMLIAALNDTSAVGVMGFSQGSRLATGICIDKELARQVKFAVLISATFPALVVSDDGQDRANGSPYGSQEEADKPITVPSVHVQGSADPWAQEAIKARNTYFQASKAETVAFKGGHTVPVARADVDRVAQAIEAAWRLSSS